MKLKERANPFVKVEVLSYLAGLLSILCVIPEKKKIIKIKKEYEHTKEK